MMGVNGDPRYNTKMSYVLKLLEYLHESSKEEYFWYKKYANIFNYLFQTQNDTIRS